ncbi:MAG: hypothetical protein EXS67_00010 [Candidatus Margulisbacteria bacterium]|nr:hypothetical protein [Candidatus Margulisiibacteriota bacterium]
MLNNMNVIQQDFRKTLDTIGRVNETNSKPKEFNNRVQDHVTKLLAHDFTATNTLPVLVDFYKEYRNLGHHVALKLSENLSDPKALEVLLALFDIKPGENISAKSEALFNILSKKQNGFTTLNEGKINILPEIFTPQQPVTLTQKETYLRGVRSSAMLGYQEAGAFAQMLNRPIVVVKNGLIETVYSPKTIDGKSKPPVFVVNYNNVHFEGWLPTTPRLELLRAGEQCPGKILSGNPAGINDCFIQALKTYSEAKQSLEAIGNNMTIRDHLAQFQETHFDTNYYVPETELAPRKELVTNATSSERLPDGFVRITNGEYFEEGTISSGVRVGAWVETNIEGKYDLFYDENGLKCSISQTHGRDDDGSLHLID